MLLLFRTQDGIVSLMDWIARFSENLRQYRSGRPQIDLTDELVGY